jgi:carbon monoxide dehydrogenase subunit G
MQVEGSYEFESERELVWKALRDPNVLGTVLPGGQGFEETGENQYAGALIVKVGPVQGTFQGQITLSNIVPPESYHIEVEGKGAPGFVKAIGDIRLEARGDQTHMDYTGQAQIGGRIASVGQRLLDSSARSIIRQSLDALNEYLKVQAAQSAASSDNGTSTAVASSEAVPTSALPTYKPPSQMALAFNVMRDVFNDFIPAKYRPWLMAAAVLIVLLLIWLIVRR